MKTKEEWKLSKITLIKEEEENSKSRKDWLATILTTTYSSLTAGSMDHDFQTNCQLSHL